MHTPPLYNFTLISERLIIRPYALDDLTAVSAMLDSAFGPAPQEERLAWLRWTIMNYTALASLGQPPYGDYAVVLRATDELIGSVGVVPSYGPFDKLPYFRGLSTEPHSDLSRPEVGLFWALSADHRGLGYATEATRALIDFMFSTWQLKRVVATTERNNYASLAVMHRLGMIVEENPSIYPEWFQMIGILPNPALPDGALWPAE
ncbi:MAG: GNAT family N-acetyltransferase [Chloroflexi bacterium]|nr:GNAT family N-acetyltransferase [Chloroflexota bacterium]